MANVLITERKLRVGDVIDWDPKSKCTVIFNPRQGGSSNIRWENGDDKKLLSFLNSSTFREVADMIAQTHGLDIRVYNKHCAADCGHIAFRFVKRRK